MDKNTALRLALEALENSDDLVRENAYSAEQLYGNYPARQGKVRGLKALVEDHEKAITAIKAALEAKDEPVAYQCRTRPNWKDESCWTPWENCSEAEAQDCWNRPQVLDWLYEARALYTTPPQRTWVGLTDEEMHECAGEYPWTPTGLKCVRAIETKLKEKNT